MPDLESLKHAPAALGLHDLIASRWSPRSFTDKPISPADLTTILTAATWAASSSNEQPWRFLVGQKGDPTYALILDALVPANQSWAASAPVLIFTVATPTYAKNQAPNYHALHDLGAASANLSLQAIALGIHTHGMGGYDHDKARTNLAIPADHHLGAVWALGYLGSPDALAQEWQRTAETTPRSRKPLSDIVFSTWNTPTTL